MKIFFIIFVLTSAFLPLTSLAGEGDEKAKAAPAVATP